MIKKKKETLLNNFLKQAKKDGTNVQVEGLALGVRTAYVHRCRQLGRYSWRTREFLF